MVVVDTNVVVAATFWPLGEGRRCFYLLAKRKFQLAVSSEILEEYQSTVGEIGDEKFSEINPEPYLSWIARRARCFEPAPLGKQRRKDPDDDAFLACARASGARISVSFDKDLRRLGKPFGIEILTPREFLRRFK